MRAKVTGDGTKAKPWKLRTPSGSSEYEMYRAEDADPSAIVCTVGKTELRYRLSAIEDLHAMLKKHGDWMPLGSEDEQKPAAEGTVEAWGRSPGNPVGGGTGSSKGCAEGLACECRRCSKHQVWRRSSRTPTTTGAGLVTVPRPATLKA